MLSSQAEPSRKSCGEGRDHDDSYHILSRQDPVKIGLVISLARPNGNLTGATFSNVELTTKQFELLRNMLPDAERIAALVNPNEQSTTETTLQDLETAAAALGCRSIL